jgi:hypothetical protein
MVGRAYFFSMFLVALFYLVALLCKKGHLSVDTGVKVIASYSAISVAYFIFGMCRDFPRLYRFFVGRMRQYSRFTRITLFDVTGTLVFGATPTLCLLALGFNETISSGIKSFSLKTLMALYGTSWFFSMIAMSIIVNHVANRRGVRCCKAKTKENRQLPASA